MSLVENQRLASSLFGGNADFLEEIYEKYLSDPESVGTNWRQYFEQMQSGGGGRDIAHTPIRESFARQARQPVKIVQQSVAELDPVAVEKQAAVLRLINAFRTRGHQAADLDPIRLRGRPPIDDLDPAFHGLSEADMDTVFNAGTLYGLSADRLPLREILAMVRETYTGNMGAEYMHITKSEEKRWLQKHIEEARGKLALTAEEKRELLRQIVAAEGLEKYLHTRFVGQKRFSLEGGDSLIPMMDALIQRAGENGAQEVVIGMAHRGRLNVLVNILGKRPADLFEEFEGKRKLLENSVGDVKYHQGFSSDVETPGGVVHLALAFNPSHLEIVNPVVEGSVRARMERRHCVDGLGGDVKNEVVVPVLIHGDAAFAGQGVVMETMQFSQVRGYRTGGTVHIVVNNQIGFTTSNPLDARTAQYCTDVAKMIQSPILHVNGDDPEAVLFVTKLAMDYRTAFKKDVVIDLVCYRRLGHNEADEPAATQPMMYKNIRAHRTTAQLYAEKLAAEQVISAEDLPAMQSAYRAELEAGHPVSRPLMSNPSAYSTDWARLSGKADWDAPVATGLDIPTIQTLAAKMLELPEGFEPHPRVAKIMDDRRKMAAGALALDWGFAENLAYAGLLKDGYKVRISGQDCGRGTFFHRHAVLHNLKDGSSYTPLKHFSNDATRFTVIDSILSEEAVMGFEYGFATADPNSLVIWEGQFGDFANGAQVVIDQFIASGEVKWGRLCGLALLLPHGFEGQGPEHSSARLERYLQLCADENMQVVVPTTPAQCFHMLRQQLLQNFRKPLVVMSPKSLLRHPLAVNQLEDLQDGRFMPVISEIDPHDADKITRVVFTTGKIYYDLLQTRRDAKGALDHVAIVRIERLYPFPKAQYEAELQKYPKTEQIVWCQDEPRNQGAWFQIVHELEAPLGGQKVHYAGRIASASVATGYHSIHVAEQKQLIKDALGE